MSNYLIVSFLHLGSHYLSSMRSQQDKGRKVRQVKSIMRRCSHFHPLCIFVNGQVRFLYHNVTPLLGSEILKHHHRFHFVKVDLSFVHSTIMHCGSIKYMYFFSLIQQLHKKKKFIIKINVHINHPDSAFTLVSKDVGGVSGVPAHQCQT